MSVAFVSAELITIEDSFGRAAVECAVSHNLLVLSYLDPIAND